MPKAILEFTLPEEKDDFARCNNAHNYHTVIWDLLQKLRGEIKYGEDKKKSEYYDELREYIFDLIRENDVSEDF